MDNGALGIRLFFLSKKDVFEPSNHHINHGNGARDPDKSLSDVFDEAGELRKMDVSHPDSVRESDAGGIGASKIRVGLGND